MAKKFRASLFDFRIAESSTSHQDITRKPLWYVLPEPVDKYTVVMGMAHEDFVSRAHKSSKLTPSGEIVIVREHGDRIYIDFKQEKEEQPHAPHIRKGVEQRATATLLFVWGKKKVLAVKVASH